MILADIGNTQFHIYHEHNIEHLSYEDAIKKYAKEELCYISVKHTLEDTFAKIKTWKNVSSQMRIEGDYETMGVDRRALCLSHYEGLFIDAGSAITVDIVKGGVYQGGFILPGLHAYLKSYKGISHALDVELDKELKLDVLATTTKEQISYGIIASIKALISQHSQDYSLYFTGGDGAFLSTFFEKAHYDEALVFLGMQNALNKSTKIVK